MNSGLIKITPQTKISTLIKANALVVEALATLNPHFTKLRNPVLRKLLAGRVTISDACKIANCKMDDFMRSMKDIGFETSTTGAKDAPIRIENKSVVFNCHDALELDVRPILSNREDPLKAILEATDRLQPNQCLKILNTFEPLPLIALLARKGFQYRIDRPEPELVITWFVKTPGQQLDLSLSDDVSPIDFEPDFDQALQSFNPPKLHIIDVRELEMPMPMLTILGYLEDLPADEALLVHHKKVPVYLLPELKEKGFSYLLQEAGEKELNMLIFKK